MQKNNWFIIDGFLFSDFLPVVNVLNTFMDSDKKRILFSFYFFNLDDCDDIQKKECIDDEFENYKRKVDASIDYDRLASEVMKMLYDEYVSLFKGPSELTKEDLHEKFLNDELTCFEEDYIQMIKEFIASETLKPNKRLFDFIMERKVLENSINTSFTANRLLREYNKRKLNYVWFEPKSQDDLSEIVRMFSSCFDCIITEDIDRFETLSYAIEFFEENDFLMAINDRIGNFESLILPKIKGFLRKENVVLNEKEYFEITKRKQIERNDR